jgi:hypothetical protein
MRLILLACGLIATVSTGIAVAQNPMTLRTGMDLHDLCSAQDLDAKLLCATFLHGISAGLRIGLVSAKGGSFTCWPSGAAVGQELLIVQKWMRDHPKALNEEGGIVAAAALLDAYQCESR